MLWSLADPPCSIRLSHFRFSVSWYFVMFPVGSSLFTLSGSKMAIFQLYCTLYIYQLAFHCKEELSILSCSLAFCMYICSYYICIHPSIHPTIHLSVCLSLVCTHGCLFSQWLIINYCPYLVWYSNCLIFGQWEPVVIGFCVFSRVPGIFWSLPYFLPWEDTQAPLTSPELSPGISHFSKEPVLSVVELQPLVSARSQDGSLLLAYLAFRPLSVTELRSTHTHMHARTLT